jgi:pimeloyl-ACP methyl ester carboxylesterase
VQRVVIVPGLAVRRYLRPARAALRRRGIDADLTPAPGQPGEHCDLSAFGRSLGEQLRGRPVDLLVGQSVGAQAAAVAAAVANGSSASGGVRHLVLVGPTMDPPARRRSVLAGRFVAAGRYERPALLGEQVPEWVRAGPRRVAAVAASARRLPLEGLLSPGVVRLTVVHAERDTITSHDYAARIAAAGGGRLVVVPGASHSWPYDDEERFADTVAEWLA